MYGFLVIGMIALLLILAPAVVQDPTVIIQPATINSITALLVLVSMNHRNQIEAARQNELKITYDNTLEGWSRALEYRDKETKGHSDRATQLTQQLAIEIGITDEDALQQIRRGALLHDIGKMAISNNILLKKEPLTDEDWVEIRKHPENAFQMLKDIPFLKTALEIPYCHHEKWDGTGYPNGLAGNEIPISARIFAVVDVWDALTTDRPYRPAWSKEDTLAYIADHKGSHFDPDVAAAFLEMVCRDPKIMEKMPGNCDSNTVF